ncbi:MAG: hypothetical protein AABW59_00420 [archaeon]
MPKRQGSAARALSKNFKNDARKLGTAIMDYERESQRSGPHSAEAKLALVHALTKESNYFNSNFKRMASIRQWALKRGNTKLVKEAELAMIHFDAKFDEAGKKQKQVIELMKKER